MKKLLANHWRIGAFHSSPVILGQSFECPASLVSLSWKGMVRSVLLHVQSKVSFYRYEIHQ